ncbi:MAG: dUTP diphosphatase [Succinivibrio sp.]|nr:dUTP diphosphatase [Succinivibrio sp.]
MLNVKLKILDERLGRDFPLPHYETTGSAGMDLRAMVPQALTLQPGAVELVPAGFALHIAEAEVAAMIYPRSGLGTRQGIVLGNLTGVIDADYQGPILMPLWNRSDTPCTIEVGERVAQLVFTRLMRINFELTSDFERSERAAGGFGSTGRN